jgi:hypothetical protein
VLITPEWSSIIYQQYLVQLSEIKADLSFYLTSNQTSNTATSEPATAQPSLADIGIQVPRSRTVIIVI